MTLDPRATDSLILTAVDFDEAVRELESLRGAHRADIAERLRDARAFGTALGDDDHLAVLEDSAVQRSKIAALERLVASATVVEAGDGAAGAAGLGSIVRVRDQAGKETEYELIGRRADDAKRTQVTPGSPVGKALMGARAGDDVRVMLPGRRPMAGGHDVDDARAHDPSRVAR
jgi:transcription elongation factor GreA